MVLSSVPLQDWFQQASLGVMFGAAIEATVVAQSAQFVLAQFFRWSTWAWNQFLEFVAAWRRSLVSVGSCCQPLPFQYSSVGISPSCLNRDSIPVAVLCAIAIAQQPRRQNLLQTREC